MKRTSRLIWLDAWIDSTLYELRFGLARFWDRVCIASNRLTVRGWRRALLEVTGEAATLGVAGMVVMLALAIPAFKETEGDWLRQADIAVTFLDRFGNEIGQRGLIQRESVPVADMPQHVIQATLATEDRRFFEHIGLDFVGLARAMSENARAGDVVQGGSTLTQQLAKNLFLTNERTLQRKINEAFLALWLEANLSKSEILQLYLDRAYMGGGTFGITAAADFYFGKQLKDVTLAEAAMLAGLFKAPAKYAPHINLPAARGRANVVLNNIVEAGFLTEGQVLAARREPASVVDRGRTSEADYFVDWAFEEMRELAPRLPAQVFTVRTTLDPALQEAAEESVEYHLRQYGGTYDVDQAAVVLLDNNGAVRAIVGGRDYGRSQFNRATSGKRPTGSSFKPYVYAAALEAGAKPDDLAADTPFSWGDWSPKNYSGGHAGRMTLIRAMATSNNVIAARLGRQVGVKAITEVARKLGVESVLDTYPPMVLGTSGVTVLEQAQAFNIFANGGYGKTMRGIEQVFGPDGALLYDHAANGPKPERVIAETTAAGMNTMLAQVPISGTARRAALDGILSAGKTGTTQDYRDAWYVGYTGNFTAAVWAGKDDYTVTNRMTGGSLPAMIWKRLMTFAHRGVDLKPIPYLEAMEVPAVAEAKPVAEGTPDDSFVATVRPGRPLPAALKTRLEALRLSLASAAPLSGRDTGQTASIAAPQPQPQP
ncbi:MAG: PBP1A family penicillin-binding protein [Rhizobiaceae bacterium]|jgi:penicillin-binding protein 1A|nr:PBP1A family penicillin-binding protein [Rhizobiaceae bacterium]